MESPHGHLKVRFAANPPPPLSGHLKVRFAANPPPPHLVVNCNLIEMSEYIHTGSVGADPFTGQEIERHFGAL